MSALSRAIALSIVASSVIASPTFTIGDCSPLSKGAGPVAEPDTVDAFEDLQFFDNAATTAQIPAGYVRSYVDQIVTFRDPDLYVGYKELERYDVGECASLCNSHKGCKAFNIFFERSPSLEPGAGCLDPPSTTVIKCTLWSGTILSENSFNNGQYRKDFKVVMAGSNAYVRQEHASAEEIYPAYTMEKYARGSAIQAPLDCHGIGTYLGVGYWHDGKFDIQRCLHICTRSKAGCHFVNTYLQRKNKVPYSQHCAMYTVHWPSKYAINVGQQRGNDTIDISTSNSFGFTKVDGNNYDACEPTILP